MRSGGARGKGVAEAPLLPGLGNVAQAQEPEPDDPADDDPADWVGRLRNSLAEQPEGTLDLAEAAVRACPGELEVLLLAALAALGAEQPERAHIFLKRCAKRYVPGKATHLLSALAYAGQGQIGRAWSMLQEEGLESYFDALPWFVGDDVMGEWLDAQLRAIRLQRVRAQARAAPRPIRRPEAPAHKRPPPPVPLAPPPIPPLGRLAARFDMRFEIANPEAIQVGGAAGETTWFRLRDELTQLGLIEGFDELLCLPALHGVETHWYQVETVRKVLKQYRGRVLLADEVGLGKTVEAGMVLKEYMLRGMAERVLILTPASAGRAMARRDGGASSASTAPPATTRCCATIPPRFWAQPRVIASIAAARRKEHAELLAGAAYDVVVVDEAHHLRDQASASYRLVNGLQKRFLLLLSATPVQNSLLELYNLLTLLQPGIFRTQKEFRAAYMVPGKPREPANRERLRDLMRGVMVRNTRALAALRLPRRHAATHARHARRGRGGLLPRR